ncbi:MAG: hypothetical protein HOV80_10365 [Polyangiaceae bacterium]|nr:hypothetical protein [Polyangiaceae bacterium]
MNAASRPVICVSGLIVACAFGALACGADPDGSAVSRADVTIAPAASASAPAGSARHVGSAASVASAAPVSSAADDEAAKMAELDKEAWAAFVEDYPELAARTNRGLAPGATLPKATRGKIQCGSVDCKVGTEHCCAFGDGAHDGRPAFYCEGTKLPGAAGDMSCIGRPFAGSGDKWACDDSSDCGGTAMCCDDYVNAVHEMAFACVQPKQAGRNACLWHERCGQAGDCKTLGTTCREGRCMPKNPQVPCGSSRCDGSAPICCAPKNGGAPSCVARSSDCSDGQTRECTRSAQCGSGMHCCTRPAGGTYCANDCTNTTFACEADADCKEAQHPKCAGAGSGTPGACAP